MTRRNKLIKNQVCVVSPQYHTSLGGIGRQALALTEKCYKTGVNLFVLARKMNDVPKCAYNKNIPVFWIKGLRSYAKDLEEMSFLNIIASLSFCFSIFFILFRKRKYYDIVHFHGAGLPLFVNVFLLKLLGKSIIAKVGCANLGTEAGALKSRYSIIGRLTIKMLKNVDLFIATSSEIKDELINEGYSKEKIVRITNFIDTETFFPCKNELKNELKKKLGFQNKRLITFTGRLVERKGIEILLKAWKEIASDHPSAKLLLLGGGHLENALKKQCRDMGIENRVKFLGFVENVREFLSVTDIFVCPSFQEGFPNSVLEAMACGCPIIATRIGGVTDVIKNGENGLLVAPGDVSQLSKALTCLMNNTDYAGRLGLKALEAIINEYNISDIASKYISLYRLFAVSCG